MTKEMEIAKREARIKLLESRGPHNTNICNKLRREIRKMQRKSHFREEN